MNRMEIPKKAQGQSDGISGSGQILCRTDAKDMELNSETGGKKSKKPKIFVLDTNIILHDISWQVAAGEKWALLGGRTRQVQERQ